MGDMEGFSWASLRAKAPTAELAPLIMSAVLVGCALSSARSKGSGSLRLRYRPTAAVYMASGIVAASSYESVEGMWKTVCEGQTVYSAYVPRGVSMTWKPATRSPTLNPLTLAPREATVPATSVGYLFSLWFGKRMGSNGNERVHTISLVHFDVEICWHGMFPVFRVGTRHEYLYEDLIRAVFSGCV
jgi:hypothetical protein